MAVTLDGADRDSELGAPGTVLCRWSGPGRYWNERTDRPTDKQVSVDGAQACVGFHPNQVAAPGVTLSRALGVHLELMLRIVIGTTDRYSSLWYLESRAIPGWEGTSEVLFFIGWVLLPNFK